jgi:hypothetical protein
VQFYPTLSTSLPPHRRSVSCFSVQSSAFRLRLVRRCKQAKA